MNSKSLFHKPKELNIITPIHPWCYCIRVYRPRFVAAYWIEIVLLSSAT